MHGRTGRDCYIKVPLGTIVRSRETGDILADIDREDMEIVIAVGGRGGRGNARFEIKSDTVSTVSPSISQEVMGPDAMIFVF